MRVGIIARKCLNKVEPENEQNLDQLNLECRSERLYTRERYEYGHTGENCTCMSLGKGQVQNCLELSQSLLHFNFISIFYKIYFC